MPCRLGVSGAGLGGSVAVRITDGAMAPHHRLDTAAVTCKMQEDALPSMTNCSVVAVLNRIAPDITADAGILPGLLGLDPIGCQAIRSLLACPRPGSPVGAWAWPVGLSAGAGQAIAAHLLNARCD